MSNDAVNPAGERLPTDTDDGMLLIISGPSGVGKTTITRAVERAIPGAVFSISATTRPCSPVDVDGVDYHFLTKEAFQHRIDAQAFLEYAEFAGNWYGTLREPVEANLARGRLMILEIDVQGAISVKKQMPEAFALFILPPDEQTLLDRLRSRKRESEETIQRRFNEAQREIATARSCGAYDTFLVNDDLDQAIEQAIALVTNERAARKARRSSCCCGGATCHSTPRP
ncbi:MAG: guanylate kinase [Phycisphaerales bacterium]|nr:guanylate kinase [Phycisphaerales bacterium]